MTIYVAWWHKALSTPGLFYALRADHRAKRGRLGGACNPPPSGGRGARQSMQVVFLLARQGERVPPPQDNLHAWKRKKTAAFGFTFNSATNLI